jgi:7-cyano-7-deazaguanine synthase
MSEKMIALLSGGLDSSVALMLAKEEHAIECVLTIDYGQIAARREIEAARKLCETIGAEHRIVELPWLASLTTAPLVDGAVELPFVSEESLDGSQQSLNRSLEVWVPNRNGLFANIAACFADARGAGVIAMGLNAEEGEAFPDNTRDFAASSTKAFLNSTLSHPQLISPTMHMDKREIAEHAVRLGVDRFFWSCYLGGDRMCGKCESCARALRAFRSADAYDRVSDRFEENEA